MVQICSHQSVRYYQTRLHSCHLALSAVSAVDCPHISNFPHQNLIQNAVEFIGVSSLLCTYMCTVLHAIMLAGCPILNNSPVKKQFDVVAAYLLCRCLTSPPGNMQWNISMKSAFQCFVLWFRCKPLKAFWDFPPSFLVQRFIFSDFHLENYLLCRP